MCLQCAVAGSLALRDAHSEIRASDVSSNLAKLLSHRAVEIAIQPPQERNDAKDIKQYAQTLTAIQQLAGRSMNNAEIAQWWRDSGASELATRWLALELVKCQK